MEVLPQISELSDIRQHQQTRRVLWLLKLQMTILSTVGKKTTANLDVPYLLKKYNKYYAFFNLLSSLVVMPMLFLFQNVYRVGHVVRGEQQTFLTS